MEQTVRKQIAEELATYLFFFDDEHAALDNLSQQLASGDENLTSRSNMRGHVTTSALVIDQARQVALLIHHNVYKRWLQPGGHFELNPVDTPKAVLWASAKREVREETGAADVELHDWSGGVYVPFDIDTHVIAPNPKKCEGQHVHHDFVYLAEADSTKPLTAQLDEVSATQWVPLSQLLDMDGRMNRIYRKLCDMQIVRT